MKTFITTEGGIFITDESGNFLVIEREYAISIARYELIGRSKDFMLNSRDKTFIVIQRSKDFELQGRKKDFILLP